MAKMIVFAANLDEIIARTKLRPGIRWGDDKDRQALIAAGDVPERWIGGLLDKRGRLVVAEDDGRIVGHNIYMTYSPIMQNLWLLINLRAGHDYFTQGGYVVPEKRGHRLLADIKGFAARHFAAEGYRRNISLVDADNQSSIKAHTTIGARPLMVFRRTRVGKISLVLKDHRPTHLTWGDKRPFAVTL